MQWENHKSLYIIYLNDRLQKAKVVSYFIDCLAMMYDVALASIVGTLLFNADIFGYCFLNSMNNILQIMIITLLF